MYHLKYRSITFERTNHCLYIYLIKNIITTAQQQHLNIQQYLLTKLYFIIIRYIFIIYQYQWHLFETFKTTIRYMFTCRNYKFTFIRKITRIGIIFSCLIYYSNRQKYILNSALTTLYNNVNNFGDILIKINSMFFPLKNNKYD